MELQSLFISTGDKVAMYTLRGTFLKKIQWRGESKIVSVDYFFRNLSTDQQEAQRKAQMFAETYGVPLVGGAGFNLNEIKRRRSDEVEAERERIEQVQREYETRMAKEIEEQTEVAVTEGVFLVGKYLGKKPSEINDNAYLFWLAGLEFDEQNVFFDKLKINHMLAASYIESAGISRSEFIGAVGEEVQVKVKLVSARWTQGAYPTICFKCQDEVGNMVTFFSVGKKFKELEVGGEFMIKGVVKEHNIWNQQKSTVINKPKMI